MTAAAAFQDRSLDPSINRVRKVGDIEITAFCDGINALGAHLEFPGFARVVKKGDGFGFEYDF